jgi:hypothetical protein
MDVAFPSELFPPFPSLRMAIDDSWRPWTAPGSVLAAVAPETDEAFRPNIVITTSRFDSDYSLSAASSVLDERIRQLPEVEIVGATTRTVDGREMLVKEVAFRSERELTLVQSYRLMVVQHDGVQDLIHGTGTCDSAHAARDLVTIRAALDSLAVGADVQ